MENKKKCHFGLEVLLVVLFTIFLGLCSTSYADQSDVNDLQQTSSFRDSFYGIETVKNILDDLNITYDNPTLLGYAVQINQAINHYKTEYDNTVTALNFCFALNTTTNIFYMIVSNGTFSDNLDYLVINSNYTQDQIQIGYFDGWNYNNSNEITGYNRKQPTYYKITSSSYQLYTTGYILINKESTDYVEEYKFYFNNLLSPISTFTVYGKSKETGYGEYFLINNIRFTKSPTTNSGDSGDTDSSGDSGNISIDLTNIENGIGTINENLNKIDEKIPTSGDIKNAVSGEVAKITGTLTEPANFDNKNIDSDDLIEAVDVDFESDPYDNMWLTITNGLNNALTGTNRTLTISFKNKNYTINLDNFSLQLPTTLKTFLAITTTVFLSWKMFKYIKEIIDKISSGNIDEVLQMNEEERDCRFILGGAKIDRSNI